MRRTLLFLIATATVLAAAVGAAAMSAATVAPARVAAPVAQTAYAPAKQPVATGFYEGTTVRYLDFGPIKLKPGNKLAPIWTFTNGAAGQRNVIDTVPGERSYTPLWRVRKVTWSIGRTRRVLKSADAVKKAAAVGDVTIVRTSTVVNCPVLGFGQKRVAGFSAGKTIHYYDLGPVKVAPGNAVLPLVAVTNGVAGQHNITEDAIAPGATDYPPLWEIVKATWTGSAHRRLLTSYTQIERAETAGELKLVKTAL